MALFFVLCFLFVWLFYEFHTRVCCYKSLFLRAHEFVVVTSTTRVFFLCIVMKFLVCFLGESSFELGVPSGMKSANLVSMTKSATASDKN